MPGKPVRAPHGKKTIELRIRFWTDNLADGEDMIIPSEGWDSGVVHLVANEHHGIESGNPVNFNSLAELPFAVEKLLIKQEITLHRGGRTQKYLD